MSLIVEVMPDKGPGTDGHGMSPLVEEFIAFKTQRNRRKDYLKGLGWYLRTFATWLGERPIQEVNRAILEQWFSTRKEAPSYMKCSINRLSSFFAFCETK